LSFALSWRDSLPTVFQFLRLLFARLTFFPLPEEGRFNYERLYRFPFNNHVKRHKEGFIELGEFAMQRAVFIEKSQSMFGMGGKILLAAFCTKISMAKSLSLI